MSVRKIEVWRGDEAKKGTRKGKGITLKYKGLAPPSSVGRATRIQWTVSSQRKYKLSRPPLRNVDFPTTTSTQQLIHDAKTSTETPGKVIVKKFLIEEDPTCLPRYIGRITQSISSTNANELNFLLWCHSTYQV